MNQTIALGPLAFSLTLLLGLFGAVLGIVVGTLVGRRHGVDVEPLLFRVATAGLVAARLAYVVQFRDAYLESPLSILDIRDGGWTPLAGFAVAALYLVVAGVRRTALRIPLAAAAGTAAAVWVLAAASLASLPEDDHRLPAISVEDLQGRPIVLSSFRGKPTVVNLWATWCPPCRREMPVLRSAQAERPDVNFVFLNQAESPERVSRFLAAEDLPLRNVLLDLHGKAGEHLGNRSLPTTLFFDAQGRLAAARVGELSRATLGERLAAISPTGATP